MIATNTSQSHLMYRFNRINFYFCFPQRFISNRLRTPKCTIKLSIVTCHLTGFMYNISRPPVYIMIFYPYYAKHLCLQIFRFHRSFRRGIKMYQVYPRTDFYLPAEAHMTFNGQLDLVLPIVLIYEALELQACPVSYITLTPHFLLAIQLIPPLHFNLPSINPTYVEDEKLPLEQR